MKKPNFTLRDLKYAVDEGVFKRAEDLFNKNKVQNIKEDSRGYDAIVQGTSSYHVSISVKHVDRGYCDCYMGQQDFLCKHMVALGLAILHSSGEVEETEKEEYSPTDLKAVKKLVSAAIRKIKTYQGPSSTWFSYQHSLDVGRAQIIEAIQNLPAGEENAKYLWNLVMKLSHKLAHDAVDDSNGTVGSCVSSLVEHLGAYIKSKPELKPILQKFTQDDTGFGFEEELAELIKS